MKARIHICMKTGNACPFDVHHTLVIRLKSTRLTPVPRLVSKGIFQSTKRKTKSTQLVMLKEMFSLAP